jgi:transposase
MYKSFYVGIDVSKKSMDVAVCKEGLVLKEHQFCVENTEAGFRSMMTRLSHVTGSDKGELFVCMEHTGIYTLTFQCLLEDEQVAYTMVSPLHLKKSLGLVRGKNDRVDAMRIADFCYTHRHKLQASKLPSNSLQRLKRLMGERDRYVNHKRMLEQTKTDMEALESENTNSRTRRMLEETVSVIEEIEEEMLTLIQKDEGLNRNYALLISIIGIGLVNAINTMIYTNNFEAFDNARQYACYVGVAPFSHQSGTSVKGSTKVSHLGNKHLKADLTQGAKSASYWDSELRLYYQKKIKEGKKYGTVINAIKFKLIERMFAVVNRGTPFVKMATFSSKEKINQ